MESSVHILEGEIKEIIVRVNRGKRWKPHTQIYNDHHQSLFPLSCVSYTTQIMPCVLSWILRKYIYRFKLFLMFSPRLFLGLLVLYLIIWLSCIWFTPYCVSISLLLTWPNHLRQDFTIFTSIDDTLPTFSLMYAFIILSCTLIYNSILISATLSLIAYAPIDCLYGPTFCSTVHTASKSYGWYLSGRND